MMETDEKIDHAVEAVITALRIAATESVAVLQSLNTKSILIESHWRTFFEDLFEDER